MSSDIRDLREQILSNAKVVLRPSAVRHPTTPAHANQNITNAPADAWKATLINPSPPSTVHQQDTSLHNDASTATLVTPPLPAQPVATGEIEVIVFGTCNPGTESKYTAAVMIGVTPAIEGGAGRSPEHALRILLLATCELLNNYMPQLGSHQRAIHGGGVFDDDLINQDLVNAQRKVG